MGYQAVIKDSDVIEGLSIRFLKFFGMWNAVNEYRNTGKRSLIIKIYIFGSFLLTVPAAIFQTQSIFTIEFDLQKATFMYMHTLPAISLCCRIIVFWFRMDGQCKLYDLMRSDFFVIPERLREKVREVYKETNKISNKCCLVPFVWNIGIQIWFIAFPGVSVEYIQHRTGSMSAVTTGKKKILSGWYPFPIEEYPYYQIVYVYECLCLLWACNVMAMYYAFFYQILMCLHAQFVVLAFRLTNLKVDSTNGDVRRYRIPGHNGNSKINEEMKEIFKDHQKLLRYTEELRSIYNPLVTMTLGIGILVLIIGAAQILLGKTSDPSFLFQLFQIFSFQFIEMALFCFGSSLIETASSDLHYAVYFSEWYRADVEFGKAVQMLMIRAKKRINLTAITIYPVNMETLGSICQFTYSTAALMAGMVE
nr:odorant receptor 22 [Graphosoma rubrolineatum]